MSELKHHGILGQKKGVRNGPPYPLGRDVSTGKRLKTAKQVGVDNKHKIPKGTKIYRSTYTPNETGHGSIYVTYEKPDTDFYKAYIYSRKKDGQKVYNKEYRAAEDLIIPSYKEQKEVTDSILKRKKEYMKTADQAIKDFAIREKIYDISLEDAKKNYSDVISKSKLPTEYFENRNRYETYFTRTESGDLILNTLDYKEKRQRKDVVRDITLENANDFMRYQKGLDMYDSILNSVKDKRMSEFEFSQLGLMYNKEFKREIIKELEKRGYNAMVDQAGVGLIKDPEGNTSRETKETLIVFNRGSLEEKKTREITDRDAKNSYVSYQKWSNKNRFREPENRR